jgi:hypothetical protein
MSQVFSGHFMLTAFAKFPGRIMPSNVKTVADCLKMFRINAKLVPASVMNDKPGRDITDVPQVGNSMSILNLAIKPHSAVPGR